MLGVAGVVGRCVPAAPCVQPVDSAQSRSVATITEELPREAICPSCGRSRRLSGRHARRNPVCSLCRHPAKVNPPTDSDRRYWLRIFSDEEIVQIAYFIFGQEGDPCVAHSWREALLPESLDLEKVLSDLLP